MRIGSFIGGLVTLAATLGVFGWWLGRLAARLCVRAAGRVWEEAEPARFKARLRRFGWTLRAVALALAAVAVAAFPVLAPSLDDTAAGGGGVTSWMLQALWVLGLVTALGVAGAAVVSVWRAGTGAVAAMRRRRTLVGHDGDGGPAEAAAFARPLPTAALRPAAALVPPPDGGRRIVICCDGTGNRPDAEEEGRPATTNVWKMYRGLVCDETQTVWYDAGVGTDTSSTSREADWSRWLLETLGAGFGGQIMAGLVRARRMVEGATGTGITENIAEAYAEIVRQYRPGDRIHLIGFSRGAYTARCVAGVIARCGLLRAEYLRYAEDVVHLYRSRSDPGADVPVPSGMVHDRTTTRVAFLGLFDTVGSLGVPLWGWWFQARPSWTSGFPTDPASVCDDVCHAMAMDERRSQFFPTPFDWPREHNIRTRLEQVWFRGAHGDVGGGYADTGLSDIALGWMMDRAERHGLRFHPEARAALRPDPLSRLHDELSRKPHWRLFGSWPRWHPVPGTEPRPDAPPGELHASVLQRAEVVQRRLGRPDLLVPRPGEPVEIETQAHREWDRTGLVLERGLYRITYQGGRWRDAEVRPCGPDGQRPEDVWGARGRRRVMARRRMPQERWMTLGAAIAHPRDWPLYERGLRDLWHYLFREDPNELRRQVAPIGRHLDAPGASVCIDNQAAPGLLYLFANDLWQTATNNAGGLRLGVERVARPDPGEVVWTLHADGGWEEGVAAGALAAAVTEPEPAPAAQAPAGAA